MLEELRIKVLEANRMLPEYGLVTFTWGNVSAIDRESGLVAIKPSGIPYENMTKEDIVIVDLSGNQVYGNRKPSSDTPTHLELYREFPLCGGIVHTHSRWASSFALARRGIACMGTTQGDYFYGEIPCTRELTDEEINGDYELETGRVIVETFRERGIDPAQVPGVLAACHGPFSWGKDAAEAVHNAVVMEEAAFMDYHAMTLNPAAGEMSKALLDRHYLRKHGKNAYYGQ